MAAPQEPISLTPETLRDLETRLADLRHNINNHLALLLAAIELIRRKPDAAARMVESIAQQPSKIQDEVQRFSLALEQALHLVRETQKP